MPVLPAAEWHARRVAHEARVDAWLAPHLARRQAGEKHPVEDFLFTYYSYRPPSCAAGIRARAWSSRAASRTGTTSRPRVA
ncbi:hypothetical protein Pflav_085390 [Phytohabitans flavus]|uniref:Uncharacterized protein n=1 Tax=Phytohabitans flavus TaxID=1076124 RepID=A0A6F8Y7X2_9ACTN|nr:hypothetical protein Pflav_085390 [Phytohabitans flavus]